MYQEPNIYNALPKIPGYDFTDLNQPHTHAKSHAFDFEGNHPFAKDVVPHPGIVNGVILGASAGDFAANYNTSNWRGTLNGGVGTTKMGSAETTAQDKCDHATAYGTMMKNTGNIINMPGFSDNKITPHTSTIKMGSGVIGGNDPGYLTRSGQRIIPRDRPLGGISKEEIMKKHPQWKSLSDKCCRFFGFFQEKIEDSQIEKMRLRKVTLTYSLNDATITVTEPSVFVNSGIEPGTLMAKHWDPAVNLRTLRIGNVITLRGRDIAIVDCDAFTRDFYNVMGVPQPEEEIEYPTDSFEQLQLRPRTIYDEELRYQKMVNESLAAAKCNKCALFFTAEEREKAKGFYVHDRETLIFFAVWDHRHFRISYYLADGTMQVTNLHAINDGRDPNAAFIKRSKIPRDVQHWPISKGSAGSVGTPSSSPARSPNATNTDSPTMRSGKPILLNQLDTLSPIKQTFFSDIDLGTDKFICILERDFYMYDCDGFTRNYYKEKYGVDLPALPKPETEGDIISRRPYLHQEKEKRMDWEKFMKHSEDVLRFAAEIADPISEEDKGREFIVCFYFADDTAQVMEFTVKNSGHPGGKIFNRAPAPPGVEAKSFFVGANVSLGAYTYHLKEMDERTDRFMTTGVFTLPSDDTPETYIARLKECVEVKFSKYTEAYRHFNIAKLGLSINELAKAFDECQLKRPPPHVMTKVFDLLDRDKDGLISLQEFTKNLLRLTLRDDGEAWRGAKPRIKNMEAGQEGGCGYEGVNNNINKIPYEQILKSPVDKTTGKWEKEGCEIVAEAVVAGVSSTITQQSSFLPTPSKTFAERRDEKFIKDEEDRVVQLFVTKLQARKAFVVEAFRMVSDMALDGRIGIDEFKNTVVGHKLNMGLNERELKALTRRFFYKPDVEGWEKKRLSFGEFRKIVEACWP